MLQSEKCGQEDGADGEEDRATEGAHGVGEVSQGEPGETVAARKGTVFRDPRSAPAIGKHVPQHEILDFGRVNRPAFLQRFRRRGDQQRPRLVTIRNAPM